MEPEQEPREEEAPEAEEPPLEKGRPLSRDESVERMYRRFGKTFEELAK